MQKVYLLPPSPLKRILAYVIDFAILNFVVLAPFSMLSGKTLYSAQLVLTAASLLAGIISILYFTLLEHIAGQTLGKAALRQHIISETQITFKALLLSNILFALFPLWLFDLAYMFYSPKRQRFTERLTRIIIVEQVQKPSEARFRTA